MKTDSRPSPGASVDEKLNYLIQNTRSRRWSLIPTTRARVFLLVAITVALIMLMISWIYVSKDLPPSASMVDMWYYIATTMSTVGYGDIVPSNPGARALVTIAQFMIFAGQTLALYMSL